MDYGQIVYAERKARRVPQEMLARALGIGVRTLIDLEHKRIPRLDKILRTIESLEKHKP